MELIFKVYNQVWKKDKTVDRVYIKYAPQKLPNYEALLPNQRYKYFKLIASDGCVTNEVNQNLNPSQKYLIQWYLILLYVGLQWLIHTVNLNVQGNTEAVGNFERTKCATYEFLKCH